MGPQDQLEVGELLDLQGLQDQQEREPQDRQGLADLLEQMRD